MKKKQIAVLLAALLSVSPAAEGVAVMGADFSAGEGTSEAVEVQMEKEESTEDAVPETEVVILMNRKTQKKSGHQERKKFLSLRLGKKNSRRWLQKNQM